MDEANGKMAYRSHIDGVSIPRTGPNERTIDCGVQPQAHKVAREWNAARNQSGLVVVVATVILICLPLNIIVFVFI